MFPELSTLIDSLEIEGILPNRKEVLQPVIEYINTCKHNDEPINLNFICTHNSRRSHLTQIWAQTLASYYSVNNVHCYSGGTQVTAVFPKIIEIQNEIGFDIHTLSKQQNPVYAVKYDQNSAPIICFSKEYDHSYNPKSHFAAIMTCSSADKNCPIIHGAKRLSVTYEDPKVSDNTPQQNEIYLERSLQIATEMKYIFSNLTN